VSFKFREQLAIGEAGEALFLEHYPEPLILYSGKSADFIAIDSGDLVELKSDMYPMDKTTNFFFERWSDVAKKKPGGPWQSRRNSVDRFIYMFAQDGTYFEFSDVGALCARLEELIVDLKPVKVYNTSWVTEGYKIPRLLLTDLYVEAQIEKEDS